MTTPFPYAGSISHGTLRDEDLVPTFYDVLRDLDADKAERFERSYHDAMAHLQAGLDNSEIPEMVPALMDALGECAPTGYYFGAIEGDGSDFGFWETDDDDDDDDDDGRCVHGYFRTGVGACPMPLSEH